MLSKPILTGATEIEVADQSNFLVGDFIMIGEQETKKIKGFASILLDSPLANAYPAGTMVKKIMASDALQAAEQQGTGESGSSSSGSNGTTWAVILLICGCCLICVIAAAWLLSRPKKKRGSTDREAYLKNDFIERQPQYLQAPSSSRCGETDPMIEPIEPEPQANVGAGGASALPPPPPPPPARQHVDPSAMTGQAGMPPVTYAAPMAGSMTAPQTRMYQQVAPGSFQAPGMQPNHMSIGGSMYTGSVYNVQR
jgi:hypothetical protein